MAAGAWTGAAAAEEASLIRAAQRGDQEAFERLVRAHDADVLRLALSLLRSPEDARDVYQETFLRAWRNLERFRLESNFQSWLYRIAANLCLDLLRKRKVRREAPAAGEPSASGALECLPELRADGDPQRVVFSREVSERVRCAIEQLSGRERLVFELRHYQGLRLKEIGEALGISEEAAKNCLFRATQKMRQALGDLL